jgi:hypothetical protein
VAALATGVLLARGTLAFLYYPLVGETSAAQKYAHNAVMLAVVAAVGAYAIRSAVAGRTGVPLGRASARARSVHF